MILITGGSGELAQSIGEELTKRKLAFRLIGREKSKEKILQIPIEVVQDYDSCTVDSSTDTLLITNGFFMFKSFEDTSSEQISELIEANFTSVVNLIWRFLGSTSSSNRRDVFVIGSTAAYDLGAGASLYGALKLGIRGLLHSLNKEYATVDTRFSLISFSTIDNSMGRLVPDQEPMTLLSLKEVASEICDQITKQRNYFEPEVILRRRFIQDHKK